MTAFADRTVVTIAVSTNASRCSVLISQAVILDFNQLNITMKAR